MARYKFDGKVIVSTFGKVEEVPFSAITMAPTRQKAESNIKYQFVRKHNLATWRLKDLTLRGEWGSGA